MKILTRTGYIDAVALFFELTDEQLDRVKANSDFCYRKHLLEEYNKSKGDNAHFFGISNTNGHPIDINSFIPNLLKEYKSVSWWDREMQEFKIINRR